MISNRATGRSQEVNSLSDGILGVPAWQSAPFWPTPQFAGQDLDEARAMEAKRQGSKSTFSSSHGDVDYAQASAELAKAIARLRVIELTKKAM